MTKIRFLPFSVVSGFIAGKIAHSGAIFRAVRGAVDRGSRELFSRLTGTWPGEEAPKPA